MYRELVLSLLAVVAVATLGRAQSPWSGLPGAQAQATAAEPRADGKLSVIVFGAHPDDCEIRAGGSARLWSDAGHHVELVSCTNGDVGHFRMCGPALAARRYLEVQEAAKLLGVKSTVLDIHDGELMPTMENRRTFVRLIREWKADIVIAHRPNDYHPDHRYTGVLVQDAAYMVTVPFFCPEAPYLKSNPVFLYSDDSFERPNPFRGDIVVAIDPVIEKKLDALLTLESQFVEGGANGYNRPEAKTEAELQQRRASVREYFRRRFKNTADRFREKLVELYGPEKGKAVVYAEAFEVCEYGRQPKKDEIVKLFPFVGPGK